MTDSMLNLQHPTGYRGPWRLLLLLTALVGCGTAAFADSYKTYDPSMAAEYATNNYDRPYGTLDTENPFTDYSYIPTGGNCTNFVSQAIMAGMVPSSSASTTYSHRFNYDIDGQGEGDTYRWFFRFDGDRGSAWTGAHKLYEYAVNNDPNYRGLHLQYVTHDTLTEFMAYKLVQAGDIIFADWEHDDEMDHTMIVTDIQWWRLGYNEIRVTYQSDNRTNRGLGDINEDYNYEALFYVYRPTDYNPKGLCADPQNQSCVNPNLEIDVSSEPSTVEVDQELSLPVRVTSQGTVAAPNARTTYDLPRELVVLSSPCTVRRSANGRSQLTCVHGDLPVGTTADASVVVRAPGESQPAVEVAVTAPSNGGLFSVGDALPVTWSSNGVDPGEEMTVSMKRDSATALLAPDGVDWIRFTETSSNSGSLAVTIPETARVASDWRAYVRHNASGIFDVSDTPFTVSSPSSVTVTLTQPNVSEIHVVGDVVFLEWLTANTLPSDGMTLSMKRDSVPPFVSTPDGINWVRFTTSEPNTGRASVTIPVGIASATDWRFYVGHNASGAFDGSDTQHTVTSGIGLASKVRNAVPTSITVTTWVEVVSDLPDADPSDNVASTNTTILLNADIIHRIDIKPGSLKNPVNPSSRGKIPVAILSSGSFDAPSHVDRASVTFGHVGAEASLHYRGSGQPNCSPSDVDFDRQDDLVCHFLTDVAGFQSGDTEGILRGRTIDGQIFEGRDLVTIVGQGHDEDMDGVGDEVEDLAPNYGDGNGDGVFDSVDTRVVSVPSATTGDYLTLVTEPCVPSNVQTLLDGSSGLPHDFGFVHPQGLLSFELRGLWGTDCITSEATVFFHGEGPLSDPEYRKYGPTADGSLPHWYSLDVDFHSISIEGRMVATATMALVDGGPGDGDGNSDGVITDPGGLGMHDRAVIDVPTLSGVGLLLLFVFMTLAAFLLIRHRKWA